MKKSSSDSDSYIDRIRSWARTKAHGPSPLSSASTQSSILPISNSTTKKSSLSTGNNELQNLPPIPSTDVNGLARQSSNPTANNVADNISSDGPPPAPPPQVDEPGTIINPDEAGKPKKKHVAISFYLTAKSIIFSSWINILLVFVPVGIAVDVAKLDPTIVFVMNAIAIVPLAGLLSHATESVAKRMGDTVGALMNITFGNAVELIIFIALSQDEIRIVQASLLGSILANLLLILGMCFLVGGLRFREQIYNSTVTQMSACLLSLAVMSLLLPTAFHAAFNDSTEKQRDDAEDAVLHVSRGTSVILLLVYGMYLLFQLKSHAYMYESTPQHIIDEESAPGPVAAWMDSSSSDTDSSSSSDSDGSSRSNTTASRIKRVMRGGRKRRKSSATSKDTAELPRYTRTSSYGTGATSTEPFEDGPSASTIAQTGHRFSAIDLDNDADDEILSTRRSRNHSFSEKSEGKAKKSHKHKKKRHGKKKEAATTQEPISDGLLNEKQVDGANEPRRVDFAVIKDVEAQNQEQNQKRPFTLRGMSIQAAIPRTFSQNVFTQPSSSGLPHLDAGTISTGPIPRVRYGIHRTNSLPDRLGSFAGTASGALPPPIRQASSHVVAADAKDDEEENISRTTAVVLLLISTGLVALCAEFMVSSISAVTTAPGTKLGETFVGLIILPIVGNAPEHVTAVSVARKNKMDLAIGVAVGSSIQIALFVTPFMVILGWCMNKPMSLYFTLFETVSLFVSAFIVNFLVLDGRSNYLEGALLCCAYVIIGVAAFYYPELDAQSILGGNTGADGK